MIGTKNRWATARLVLTGLLAAVCIGGSASAEPAKWIVRPAESKISFSGTHAGREFTGQFGSWTADIRFDPKDLAGSKAVVLVNLASAFTGDQTYDKTLPTADWFDVSKFSEGRFETAKFTASGGNKYEALATLSLRGVNAEVLLKFTFEEQGATAKLSGETTLQRVAFGIGKGSDASGDWVSLDIPVSVSVVMDKAP